VEFYVNGVDVFKVFQDMATYAPNIALEQMSKAGSEVREQQRKALKSTTVHTVTRVGKNGKKYLADAGASRAFGAREEDNQDANPSNMASFINSFLMEGRMVMVVNGSHRAFRPILRRDGEVIGVGNLVGGVSKETHAILQRMNDNKILSDYPIRSQLATKKQIGTHYADTGNSRAKPKVVEYLTKGYEKTMERVIKKSEKQIKAKL